MSNTKKGTNWFTSYIKKSLGPEKNSEISNFILATLSEDYLSFTSEEEVYGYLGDIVKQYIYSLDMEELTDLKYYTGYDFRNINNTMRGKWNYEENGLLTNEKKEMYNKLGEKIYSIINKCPSLNINIKAYRGVNIKAFWDYGIYSIEDLIHMEGQYFYESGFSSTSLLKSQSFFEKPSDWGDRCNVEIEYYIPGTCQDGAILISDALSYSKGQMEYVINSSSLIKITKVTISEDKQKARIKAVLIPRKLWDPIQYEQDQTPPKK